MMTLGILRDTLQHWRMGIKWCVIYAYWRFKFDSEWWDS